MQSHADDEDRERLTRYDTRPPSLATRLMSLLDHPRMLPLLVAGAFFMEFLDGTVIATALPAMAQSFAMRPVDLSVGMSAYLFTLALLLPASGFMAERFGARMVFCSAIAVFTLASIACGLSTGLWSFTLARIVQGAGGAMMVPVGRLSVLRATPKSDLMRAIAILTWPALAAPILAPPLGGFITTYANWRWIFFINVPLGLAGLLLAWHVVPATRADASRRFDVLGFILAGLAVLVPLSAVELLGRETVDWGLVLVLSLAGLGFGWLALRHMGRHAFPILPLDGLAVSSFMRSVFGGSLFRIAVGAVPFLLPLMFQVGFGLDAFRSGLLVLALFVGNMGIKPLTSGILRRYGFRVVLILDGMLAALAIGACGAITPAMPLGLTVALLVFAGATRSMGLTTINTLAFAEMPPAHLSGANTLFSMLQQISFGLGVALGAVALRIAQNWRPAQASHATPLEFRIAFALIGIVALGAVLDAFRLPADAGDEVARS